MAGIRKKGNAYYCTFRFQGKRYHFTVGKVPESQAQAKGAEVDETLGLIERGRLTVPEGVTLTDFVAAGGKSPVPSARPVTTTFRQLADRYLDTHGNGAIESTTLGTARIHLNHIAKSVGERFRVQDLTTLDLQGHVDRRRRKGVAAATVRKEVATFRACWNWAEQAELLNGPFPGKAVRFPKEEEKERFRSFAEVQAIIAAENPDDARRDVLWESLYLTRPEVDELLDHVRRHATLPWVYPMVAFAAFTGARRSEILAVAVSDIDLDGGTATIQEKKRIRGRRSTRNAPISPRLHQVLRDWLVVRPGSPFLFCQDAHVARSKTKRISPSSVTKDEAHDHFRRTLAGSKWQVLRGYHVLRHSFISALASEGIDQRVIDEIVGHQSEEQRKRYRHLHPRVMKAAIERVFG